MLGGDCSVKQVLTVVKIALTAEPGPVMVLTIGKNSLYAISSIQRGHHEFRTNQKSR